jgi:hypothetical protein
MWNPTEPEKDLIRHEYSELKEAVDALPYTDSFEVLFSHVCQRTGCTITRSDFWRRLANMRKNQELPRKTQ